MDDKLEVNFSANKVIASYYNTEFFADLQAVEQTLSKTGSALTEGLPYLLPVAVRWMSPDCEIVVLEHPPRVQPIYFSPKNMMDAQLSKDHVRYDIALPWQVYILDLVNGIVWMFVRTHPLSDQDDELFSISLPNLAPEGTFCQHHDYVPWVNTQARSISEKIRYLMIDLWGSGFNLNMLYRPSLPVELSGQSNWTAILKHWETFSCRDVLTWKWPPMKGKKSLTLRAQLTGLRHDYYGEMNTGTLKNMQRTVISAAQQTRRAQTPKRAL